MNKTTVEKIQTVSEVKSLTGIKELESHLEKILKKAKKDFAEDGEIFFGYIIGQSKESVFEDEE